MLPIARIPNARVWQYIQEMALLANLNAPQTVRELRQKICEEGVEPED
ncbi:MAG: hypothetical protein O4803_04845 [Trichodesmium sp. St15_bin1_1]|jgi:hypothetical protein|nr:hypothetical protein [Trichodesmium sp. St15_bin1_1]MDE5121274.1 hypothetical protein [Trichodesmium sp. St19_bin1]